MLGASVSRMMGRNPHGWVMAFTLVMLGWGMVGHGAADALEQKDPAGGQIGQGDVEEGAPAITEDLNVDEDVEPLPLSLDAQGEGFEGLDEQDDVESRQKGDGTSPTELDEANYEDTPPSANLHPQKTRRPSRLVGGDEYESGYVQDHEAGDASQDDAGFGYGPTDDRPSAPQFTPGDMVDSIQQFMP